MKKLLLIALLTFSFGANAALISSLNGQAYYDTDTDLTWLADANYAQTSGYDIDGRMNWQNANDWAAQLTVDGVSGWRLPATDASCGSVPSCATSEIGNLFYNILGNVYLGNPVITIRVIVKSGV